MEDTAAKSSDLQSIPRPRWTSPLRLRLMRLCLDHKGMPCPDKLEGLRNMSLAEALLMEDVAHHRQREILMFSEVVQAAPTGGPAK